MNIKLVKLCIKNVSAFFLNYCILLYLGYWTYKQIPTFDCRRVLPIDYITVNQCCIHASSLFATINCSSIWYTKPRTTNGWHTCSILEQAERTKANKSSLRQDNIINTWIYLLRKIFNAQTQETYPDIYTNDYRII